MKRFVLAVVLTLLAGSASAQSAAVITKTNSLTSSAVTADQVVLTYTVTANRKLFLEYLTIEGQLTAVSATASVLGDCSLEFPSGTKNFTHRFIKPTTSAPDRVVHSLPHERITVQGGNVVRVVCTPAASTSMLWRANFGGYEQ
jgi:hypothetical protein